MPGQALLMESRMIRVFECRLETDGFRLQVTVRTACSSEVEAVAKQLAAERLRQTHGIERGENQFKVIVIEEKRHL